MDESDPKHIPDTMPIPDDRQHEIMSEHQMDEFRLMVDGTPGLTPEQRLALNDRSLSLAEANALYEKFIQDLK